MCQPTSSKQRYECTWTHVEALHYLVDTHTCTHRVYIPNNLCMCTFMARREKKGARAETAARKKVSSSHRLFFQAAALSGLPSDKVCALMDFNLLSTAAAMELVEASMEHLPGRAVVLPTLDGVRTHLEHNWFLLRDSFNRMQRALEHGLHVLVHTLTMYILIMYTLKMYTLVMYTLILYTP